MKIKAIGIILVAFFCTLGVYETANHTNTSSENPLINISELPKEFMNAYMTDYAKIANSHNKENILIVTSQQPLKNDFGAQKIIKAANNQYFLEYNSEEAKNLAFEQIKNTPNLTVSKNHLRTISEDEEESDGYNSWGIKKMGLDYASELIENRTSKHDVVVAIADTGLDIELFKENYPKEKLAGWYSVINHDEGMYDEVGHGTHIAGTIAEGTPGNVKIFPVQLSDSRSFYSTDVIATIDYIVYFTDADVINMSFGGYEYTEAEYLSIEAAKEKGIISVAAAGNESTNDQSFPSGFKNTLSISAVNSDLEFASEFSNFGSTIDFAAPGVQIKSINATFDGTSMATPHVAAAAAILKSLNKDFTVDSARSFLATRAIDLGPIGKDSKFGYGFIDFHDAKFCTTQSETCDEFSIFETEIEDGLEIGEVFLTPYNYGSLTNILATTIKIKNKSGNYSVARPLGDFGTDVEVTGYNPYLAGEQEVTVKYKGFTTSFTVTNPENWEIGWKYSEFYNYDTNTYNVAIEEYRDHNLDIKTLYIPETINEQTVSTSGAGCMFNSTPTSWPDYCTYPDSEDAKHYETLVFPATFKIINGFGGDEQTGRLQNLFKVVSLADEVKVGNNGLAHLANLTTIEGVVNFIKEKYVDINGDEYEKYLGSAFSFDKSLVNITLSDNLEAIPESTFADCKSLETIEFPASVTEIGKLAFSGTGIKTINLKNVQKLKERAFDRSKLEEITIPAGLTEIESGALSNTAYLKSIAVAPDNPVFDSRDNSNAIIKTSENKLIVGTFTTKIPTSIKIIGENAFNYVLGLEEITIPEGVETIEAKAFRECFYLQKIVLPKSLASFSEDSFERSGISIPSGTVFWVWNNSSAKDYVFEHDYSYVLIDDIEEGKEPKLIANATFEVMPEGKEFHAFETFSPNNFIIKIFYYDAELDKVAEEPEIVTEYNVIYNNGESESLIGGYNNVNFVFNTTAGHKNIKINLTLDVKYLPPEYEIPTGITAYSGQALAEIKLPEGFAWMNEDEFVDETKTEYLAEFTPEDATHYETIKDIVVSVEVKTGTTLTEIFPDEVLRTCIITNLNEENNTEYTEETAELDKILAMTKLDCANSSEGNGITNARGIEKMAALKSLNLANNSLSRINLSQNEELENLNLMANELRTLDLVKNPKLVELLVDESRLGNGQLTVKTTAYMEIVYTEGANGITDELIMDISKLQFLKDVDFVLEDSTLIYDAETGIIKWPKGATEDARISIGGMTYSLYGFPRSVYFTTILNGKIYEKDFNLFCTFTGDKLNLDTLADSLMSIYGLSDYVLEDIIVASTGSREYTVGIENVQITLKFISKKKPTPVFPDNPEPKEDNENKDTKTKKDESIKAPETGSLTKTEMAKSKTVESPTKGKAVKFSTIIYFTVASIILIITIVLLQISKHKNYTEYNAKVASIATKK